jgi:hypothetical protein
MKDGRINAVGETLEAFNIFNLNDAYYGSFVTVTCHFRRGFRLANRFIGYSPDGTTINYKTFNLPVSITLCNCEQW